MCTPGLPTPSTENTAVSQMLSAGQTPSLARLHGCGNARRACRGCRCPARRPTRDAPSAPCSKMRGEKTWHYCVLIGRPAVAPFGAPGLPGISWIQGSPIPCNSMLERKHAPVFRRAVLVARSRKAWDGLVHALRVCAWGCGQPRRGPGLSAVRWDAAPYSGPRFEDSSLASPTKAQFSDDLSWDRWHSIKPLRLWGPRISSHAPAYFFQPIYPTVAERAAMPKENQPMVW